MARRQQGPSLGQAALALLAMLFALFVRIPLFCLPNVTANPRGLASSFSSVIIVPSAAVNVDSAVRHHSKLSRQGFGSGKNSEVRWGVSGTVAAILAAAALGLRGVRSSGQRLRERGATIMGAKRPVPTRGQVPAIVRVKDGSAMLTVVKKKNNTHVCLGDLTGKAVWATSEKRYGKLLPNANRAVEAALFVAEKLGIKNIVLQIKGVPAMMGGVINTVRASGLNVSQAYIRNNIAYGGCRPRHIRH
eukprot:TRINITY_DN76849_c0_g1_i1.p1 TRINITY_DN76849_c0_g1~~TRINITY_DN76849_c0_g1_i1.p1  ORF type:complete len:257 (-),score=35.64 TRINITY_DN76849_c0_g1_i1:79-819(-)